MESFCYRMLLRTCSNFRRFKISPVSSISVRNLTQSEASVALRPFYFAVHPDRFAKDLVIQSQNEKSLQILRFRIDPLRFFGHRTLSTFDISHVMESLKKQFDVNNLKIEKIKISVLHSMFKGMAVENQHKFIIDLLPEDLRNDVIVESSALPEESADRENIVCIQRFSNPIAMILRFRIDPLRFFGRRTLSTFDISRVMESLEKQFDVNNLKIEKIKISVHDSMFKGMAVENQHKFIIDLLPEDLRNDVIVESSSLPEESADREVRKVYLSKVPILPDNKIPATPQVFLDIALYHLSKSSGALASECLWLCGSLALKNFCISNGFNPKTDNSNTRIVDFLSNSFDHFDLFISWSILNDCQRNSYEDALDLHTIRKYLKHVELFCNILFEIHASNQFNCEQFKKFLPKSMKEKGNIFFEFY